MTILSIDPGETSGYVLAKITALAKDYPPFIHLEIVQTGEWTGVTGFLDISGGLFNDAIIVVCEDYRIYPNRLKSHAGARPYTLLELGRIELIAHAHGVTEDNGRFVYQAASMAKQRWPDNRIKDWMMRSLTPLEGISKHERDALRHLLTYVERTHERPVDPTRGASL